MDPRGVIPQLDGNWRRWALLLWLAVAALMIVDRWDYIRWFALGDTDDNMRIMQVRALLHGQNWFDLRQYRLNPPYGADIHWSRLVDLPIAGIILALRHLTGGRIAEQVAVGIAPLLPMLPAFLAVGLIARRLVARLAWPLAIALLLCGHSTRGMWTPLRIDHHGWQLAMLALSAAALTDPKRARGGMLLGIATAVSLAIGLEMLIYSAVAGAVVVLLWVRDRAEAPRLAAYGASLAGGCAIGFLLFASYANRAPVCDALSPVWLSAMVAAGAVAVLLSRAGTESWRARLALAAVGGAAIATAFALAWPNCLGRPEHISPELDRLWLSHVREARPIYIQNWQVIAGTAALPFGGLVGYALMLWRERRRSSLLPWAALAALALTAALLLLWQTRAGAAAQLLAVPGATALVWLAAERIGRSRSWIVTAVVALAAFLLVSGVAVQSPFDWGKAKPDPRKAAVNRANARCPALSQLYPIARVPKGYVLTFVDLGPRLITVTHHDAVAGPYHRNGAQILDIHHFFRGNAGNALATVRRLGVDYVLICPNLSESTIYRSEAPKGFYAQLASGKVPAWLDPVELPKDSLYRMWRVKR